MHKGKKVLAIIMVIISALLLAISVIIPSIVVPLDYSANSFSSYIEHCIVIGADFMKALNNTISFTSIIDELVVLLFQTLVIVFELFIFIRAFVAIFVRNAKCKIIGKVILICLIHGLYYLLISYNNYSFIPNEVLTLLNSYFDSLKNQTVDITFFVIILGNVLLLILELFRRINIKTNPDDRKFETIDLFEFYRDK